MLTTWNPMVTWYITRLALAASGYRLFGNKMTTLLCRPASAYLLFTTLLLCHFASAQVSKISLSLLTDCGLQKPAEFYRQTMPSLEATPGKNVWLDQSVFVGMLDVNWIENVLFATLILRLE